jgi:molecular chaperone GrpE
METTKENAKTQVKAAADKVKPEIGEAVAGARANMEQANEDLMSEIAAVNDKWKRALADAENARKRADTARIEGREHGIALAVEALAPALDALALGIEAAKGDSDADDPRIVAHLEGLKSIRNAFETGLKALGVRAIAPEDVDFDPKLHEAMGTQETGETKPGQVLVLHRPGYAIGQRLIRPARVTVSAAPKRADPHESEEMA